MSLVPESISTIGKIYARYEEVAKQEPKRKHLGGSEIGQQCERKLWYSFHHCFDTAFDGRMHRLFQTGHLEEDRVVADLMATGAIVTDRQKKVLILGGFFGGSIDGVIEGLFESPKTLHLFECKTHSDSSFVKLRREGVEKAKPEHWIQMHTYMGLNKLTRACYIAKNKNNDELYMERVHFDPDVYKAAIERAKHILTTRSLAPRLSTNPESYVCRYCEFKFPCHANSQPKKNCRTCTHSYPILDGEEHQKLGCNFRNEVISDDVELTGCESYQVHEALQVTE